MTNKRSPRFRPAVAKILLSAMFLGAMAFSMSARADGAQPRLVVFGGSLSDSGNLFALQKQNNVPPSYDLDATAYVVPNSAYARGGHHLSNGPTWAEEFAKARGWVVDAGPAFASANPRAGNYAVAGARARSNSATPNVSLDQQIGAFLQRPGGGAPTDALYVIDFGGNDVRDALVVALGGGNPTPVIADALQSIYVNVLTLYSAGARRFLVLNVPNISLMPSITIYGPAATAGALQLTQVFNQQLEGVLTQLDGMPGVDIQRFDLFAATNEVHAQRTMYGLVDVTNPCITPDAAPYVCRHPDQFFFWDGIHPTRAVHAILARMVVAGTR